MTSLRKKAAARSFQPKSPSFSLLRLLLFVVLLAVFSFVAFIVVRAKVDGLLTDTKTVAGHNLEPTPWHRFHVAPLEDVIKDDDDNGLDSSRPVSNSRWWSWWWSWYPRAATSRILQCSHLLACPPPLYSFIPADSKHPRPHQDSCPAFFQWISYDLSPWSHSHISLDNLKQAQKHAAFRVVISGGRLFVEFYYACVQTRSMFTIWGLFQLLRRYPGLIPDVDLMFDCMDKPMIGRSDFKPGGRWPPPPLFCYCTTKDHFDIPFPDWSFWGWPEVNIGPWDEEFRSIKQGSHELNWEKKTKTAYWKGNPDVASPVRKDLLHCNDTNAWGAQIFRQNWVEEAKRGYQQSKLSSQCNNRYKIYAEGFAWSVSLKYIIACGSVPLIIHPQYEDFFSRGLMPRKNYWPINRMNLCPSIKFGVDWGNEHPQEAETIGQGGQDFMETLNMERVYDYMYHLIVEYSKLLDFKPTPPSSAQEICEDYILCFADQKQRKLLRRSLTSPSSIVPCTLPKPDDHFIQTWIQEKQKIIDDIQKLETTWKKNETGRS